MSSQLPGNATYLHHISAVDLWSIWCCVKGCKQILSVVVSGCCEREAGLFSYQSMCEVSASVCTKGTCISGRTAVHNSSMDQRYGEVTKDLYLEASHPLCIPTVDELFIHWSELLEDSSTMFQLFLMLKKKKLSLMETLTLKSFCFSKL